MSFGNCDKCDSHHACAGGCENEFRKNVNRDVETGEALQSSDWPALLSGSGESNSRADQLEDVSAVLRFQIGGLADVSQHALLHWRLQQQQQQTLQTVDHSRSRVPSAPTLLFGDFLIAAGHRRSRQSHELKAVVDHHVRHSLVWIPHHAEPQLGEHSAVPDGFGVREAQQIVQTRLQRVAVDRALLALHRRIKSLHVAEELAVRREREVLVRRDGLQQGLDLLRIYELTFRTSCDLGSAKRTAI